MINFDLLVAYFGPDGPYAQIGNFVRKVRRTKLGRYALAISVCMLWLLILVPVALILESASSHKTAASICTPLFWIGAVAAWCLIVPAGRSETD